MAARIKKDDQVEVISGAHRGARGKILRIFNEKNRVLIEGVNMVYRHVRKSRQHPQGGRIQKEAAIHMSNVQPVDPKTDRPTRVRFTIERDEQGRVVSKQRVAVSGTVLSEVTRAKRGVKVERA